jgi:hypothetical protein
MVRLQLLSIVPCDKYLNNSFKAHYIAKKKPPPNSKRCQSSPIAEIIIYLFTPQGPKKLLASQCIIRPSQFTIIRDLEEEIH